MQGRESGRPRVTRGCVLVVVLVLVIGGGLGWWAYRRAGSILQNFEDRPVAAARWMLKAIPELEEVEVDEEAQTITVRHLPSGRVAVLDVADFKGGRIAVATDEGELIYQANEDGTGRVEVTSGRGKLSFETGDHEPAEAPDWLPQPDSFELEGQHSVRHDTGISGGYRGLTPLSLDDLETFYAEHLTAHDFKVTQARFEDEGRSTLMLTGRDPNSARTIIVTMKETSGGTHVALTFNLSGDS